MKKRLVKSIYDLLPTKTLRRQKFINRMNNKKLHDRRYGIYRYRHTPKTSQFNQWQDYKRLFR